MTARWPGQSLRISGRLFVLAIAGDKWWKMDSSEVLRRLQEIFSS
jgi:hypothetical protein